MTKSTQITLVIPQREMRISLSVEHAERLLRMKRNGGWQLPSNSEYVFENGIISKRSKGKGKRGKK